MTKIFMAVVALFAVSCTTDMTGDLAPELGLGEGQTTLTLSLEESRTQLGEKVGELYPLYWSENDVIAVNGTASTGISILEEWGNKAAARFSFGENTVSRPFHVIYPAPAEGVEAETEGCYPVVFPATQTYAEGTFAAGTAPMYGYAAAPAEGEEAAPVQMQHLTGILRLAVKGDVTLSTLVIKAESGSLSGTYDVNCESGALTAQEGSTSDTVTVSFDGGLPLKADEATPIYVAVPAGSYGAVRAILTTTEDKKMTIKFDSDSKPIAKATVREFTEFTFAENALDGDVFEIYDVEDMLMFAKTATSFPWSEAKLMATVDMAGVEWTPVGGFSKIFNGNYSEATPYEIKNLSAPLFGTTTATIKNVKLTDVNINIATAASSNGALVRVLNGGTVENCEVSGSMTINGGNYCYGGIVGIVNGASTLKDLTNRCSVTVTINNNKEAHVGGVLGKATEKLTISNCDNYGAVTVSGTDTYKLRVGGIIGYIEAGGATTANDINNYGEVTVTHAQGQDSHIGGVIGSVYEKSTLTNSSNGAGGKVFVKGVPGASGTGGIVGYASSPIDMDNCSNCDSVKISLNCSGQAMLGGLVGYNNSTAEKSIKNSTNSGVIYAEGTITGAHCRAGGFVGYSAANTTIEDSTNNGAVTIKISSKAAFVAGFCGYAGTNTGTNLTNNAKISYEGTATGEDLQIGGIVGQANSCTFTTVENSATGNIVFAEGASTKRYLYGGGLFGRASGKINGAINRGTVEFNGASTNIFEAGGVIGYASATITTATNYGTLNFGGTSAESYCTGGVVGYLVNGACTGLTNESTGTMTVNGAATTYCAVGGVVGYTEKPVSGATNKAAVTFGGTAGSYYAAGGVVGEATGALTSLTNESTGALTFNATATACHNVGGVVGRTTGVDLTTLENKAALTYSGHTTATSTTDGVGAQDVICVGGVAGAVIGTEETYNSVTGLTNSGLVTLSNFKADSQKLATPYTNFGGVIGYVTLCNLDNCDNTATEFKQEASATINKLEASSNKHEIRIGGIVGYAPTTGTIQNCENSATLYLDAPHSVHHRIGGLFGSINATISSCTNNGHLAFGSTFYTKRFHIGGLAGALSGSLTSCTNNGNISYAPASQVTNQFYLGGLVGQNNGTVDSSTNNGIITLGKKCTTAGAVSYIGGVVGYHYNAASVCKDSANYGNLIVDEAVGNTATCVGGIAGTAAANSTIKDSKVFCSISAGELTNVGFVLGATRTDTRFVTNCSLGGGTIKYSEEEEDYVDDLTLNIGNFMHHIYGGDTDWTGITNYDGCGFLESKTAEPSYPSAE